MDKNKKTKEQIQKFFDGFLGFKQERLDAVYEAFEKISSLPVKRFDGKLYMDAIQIADIIKTALRKVEESQAKEQEFMDKMEQDE